ncbi:MAG TPA: histidine ammonia-lyase [Ignavibacteria bacterium]|nr:histidine ammonia-lyase [Bacteroidota bacterium]HRI86306.1 histidine ammonia-lyase [Ignavibacteria bacterium]HRJ99585.1 histidine ammonia-lyase [Ignavibacteria bacterium]
MQTKFFTINGSNLTVENSILIVTSGQKIRLQRSAEKNIKASAEMVKSWIANNEVIYGVTTGFGEFKDVRISQKDSKILQRNLILSHSAGVGKFVPDVIARLMLLFRINSLAKGFSGVRPELIQRLISIFNSGIIPLIPSKGSVGSSGDLSPLSHLALLLIGEGFCKLNGNIIKSSIALKSKKLQPFELSAKEGLAMINGTQMMSAYICKSIFDAEYISKLADISGSMSLEALRGTDKAFSEKLQSVRPHPGQKKSAANLRKLLKGSEIMRSHRDCGKVQDAYSLRCMPQVHGAVKDTISHCKKVLETEINSATDNPLLFPESGEHIEGGNFHGEPLAFIADFLAIAVSELGNISERRTARLLDGSLSGLPRFLTSKGGLNSGLMIAQYTAASLVSENKVLCHPASVDSIPTSANQEDHNSMGSVSSIKCFDVINNVKNIISIEFLCAAQGMDFLRPLKSGAGTEKAYSYIRKFSKHIKEDTVTSEQILNFSGIIYNSDFLSEVENNCGKLF